MAATAALRQALNQGISSGTFADTKIVLYSHRDPSGRICRPKALYANSQVLNHIPCLNTLLFGNSTKAEPGDFKKDVIECEEYAVDYGYSSDSDLEDDEDQKVAWSNRKSKSRVYPFNPYKIPDESVKIPCEKYEEHSEGGTIVIIPDVAFITFQAFLMYLYTGVIEFAPFGSRNNRTSRSGEIVVTCDDKVPRSSPKSIYRLANKYGVPGLKTLALNRIRSELEKCDIVEESFSRFASQHSEIRSLYIAQLASMWMEDSTTETIRARVDKKIEEDPGHAMEAVSALWKIANEDDNAASKLHDTEAPPNIEVNRPTVSRGKKFKGRKGATNLKETLSASRPEAANKDKDPKGLSIATLASSPAHWAAVNNALIKSIRSGIFFDRKYWARHSKVGDILKPVYFSSIVVGDKEQQLSNMVTYLKGRTILVNDREGGTSVDSDCESYSARIGDGGLKGKEESRAVLVVGSFSAWKSLFFYRCTDSILFAPLISQGVDFRSHYIRSRTVAVTPPPCSPKSIYVLAGLLGIEPLRDEAFADIKNKVSQDNVVDEVFSWFTANQREVMEFQCKLLVSEFNNPRSVALVKENIGRMSDGSLPFCAGALKVGLRKAFDLKKQKRQPPGVSLRCTYSSCTWYRAHVSYSSVGSDVFCPQCGCGYYMQCVGCGYGRTSDYASCQSCGKRFT